MPSIRSMFANAVGILTDSNTSGSLSGNRLRGRVRLGTYEANCNYSINSGRISKSDRARFICRQA